MVKVGEPGSAVSGAGVSRTVPFYCTMYLQGDLFLSLAGLLQYRKVLLLIGSLGESEYFCGWAGSKSIIMS